MPGLPSYKPKEVIKKFERLGYYADRQSGSHVIMYNRKTKRRSTIPLHRKDIPIGTLRSIIQEAGLTKEEFIKA